MRCAGTLVHHSYGHWIVTSGTVVGAGALNGCKTVQISEPRTQSCHVCHCAGIVTLDRAIELSRWGAEPACDLIIRRVRTAKRSCQPSEASRG